MANTFFHASDLKIFIFSKDFHFCSNNFLDDEWQLPVKMLAFLRTTFAGSPFLWCSEWDHSYSSAILVTILNDQAKIENWK